MATNSVRGGDGEKYFVGRNGGGKGFFHYLKKGKKENMLNLPVHGGDSGKEGGGGKSVLHTNRIGRFLLSPHGEGRKMTVSASLLNIGGKGRKSPCVRIISSVDR